MADYGAKDLRTRQAYRNFDALRRAKRPDGTGVPEQIADIRVTRRAQTAADKAANAEARQKRHRRAKEWSTEAAERAKRFLDARDNDAAASARNAGPADVNDWRYD